MMTQREFEPNRGTRADQVLDVENLTVELEIQGRMIPAVSGVSLSLERGTVRGLVGESGCGKSLTAMALMGLLPPGSRVTGKAELGGRDLLMMTSAQRTRVNGRHLAMIFQEPMTALHPMITVGRQMAEGMRHHLKLSSREARRRSVLLLDRVGIPRPEKVLDSYVHELSGGMRQRVMIAMMISCDPDVIIADEPTTALDVTIQAQILQLLEELARDIGTALLLVTHDLNVVAQHCDNLTVMYAGKVVEEGPVREIVKFPRHPYTRDLLAARPRRDEQRSRLNAIPGRVPSLGNMPVGCNYAPRCSLRQPACETEPQLVTAGVRGASCWFPLEGENRA